MNFSSTFYIYCSRIFAKFFNLVKIAKNKVHFFLYSTVEKLTAFCYNIFKVTYNNAVSLSELRHCRCVRKNKNNGGNIQWQKNGSILLKKVI